MNTVWKFELEITDSQTLSVPVGSSLAHVGLDPNGVPCLWLIVDDKAPMRNIEIVIRGNGQKLPHVGSFLGTVMHLGTFMWHVFTGPHSSLPRAGELHYLSKERF